MNYDQLEKRLRRISLRQPDSQIKQRLLRQAASRLHATRRGRRLRWALAATAGILIATNLVFGQVHEQRLAVLTGRPGIQWVTVESQRILAGATLAESLAYREQILSDILGPNGNS